MLSSPQRYTVEIQHSMTIKDVFVPNVHTSFGFHMHGWGQWHCMRSRK